MSLFDELKRRNVFRIAVAYTVIAWLLAQVADLAFDNFGAPDWVPKSVLFILILGFPLAVFFAWAFEMTPEGVKREKDVDRSHSITQTTGKKLNHLIIAVLVAAIGFLLLDKFVLQTTTETAVAKVDAVEVEKSVAVLPFVAMSDGPDDEYFADGLTEEILNSLAHLPDLLVTARTSAFSFKGMDIPIPEIAAKLGVANVVEGSVRRSGDRLRVTAQLIRAKDGFHLWSETYDRAANDSFGVQDEIAEKVASALNVVLDDAQLKRMRSSGLRNPEAFVALQKGRELYDKAHGLPLDEMSSGLLLANEMFAQTLALEPGASQVHFAYADYYIHFLIDSYDPEVTSQSEMNDALQSAKTGLQRAMETATTDAQRLDAALEFTLIAGEWQRMGELFSSALQSNACVNPSWWGSLVYFTASLDEPIAMWQKAIGCDPLNFYNRSNLAALQIDNGDFEAAIDTATRSLQIVQHRQIADQLVRAYMAAGRFDEALAANQRHLDDPRARHQNLLRIAAAQGKEVEARALLLEAENAGYGVGPELLAMIGDREGANRRAAEIDALPLGFMVLLDSAGGSCLCGQPFDLDATPNFARLVEEANLAWPPREPITWPLKDW
jgi:TolB-like protein/tetratricopeptide (TPR) repeat protein